MYRKMSREEKLVAFWLAKRAQIGFLYSIAQESAAATLQIQGFYTAVVSSGPHAAIRVITCGSMRCKLWDPQVRPDSESRCPRPEAKLGDIIGKLARHVGAVTLFLEADQSSLAIDNLHSRVHGP